MLTATFARVAVFAQASLPKPSFRWDFPGAELVTTMMSWLLGVCALACLAGFFLAAGKRGLSGATNNVRTRAEANGGMAAAFIGALALGAGWFIITFAVQTGQTVS